MTDGGVIAQDYAAKHADSIDGLVLVSAFLQRKYRPDVAECLPKAAIKVGTIQLEPLCLVCYRA